jgi:methylated-DNA-[protein]-cysteine S-methyltransferase
MPTTVCRVVDSPIGPLTIAGDGQVVTALRMAEQAHEPSTSAEWVRDDRVFGDVAEQLRAYFAGELTAFDVPLRLEGTAFQRSVWSALTEIPYGRTWSYGQVGAHIGKPSAMRAVGLANGRNPVAIIVPCHRVIGASGKLVGYGGGLDRKVFLLELEKRAIAA